MVIIAAVPGTPRRGLSAVRSMSTPSAPESSMVPTSATTRTPTREKPVRMTFWPLSPSACRIYIAMKEPTMKTLKWAKLISSMIP